MDIIGTIYIVVMSVIGLIIAAFLFAMAKYPDGLKAAFLFNDMDESNEPPQEKGPTIVVTRQVVPSQPVAKSSDQPDVVSQQPQPQYTSNAETPAPGVEGLTASGDVDKTQVKVQGDSTASEKDEPLKPWSMDEVSQKDVVLGLPLPSEDEDPEERVRRIYSERLAISLEALKRERIRGARRTLREGMAAGGDNPRDDFRRNKEIQTEEPSYLQRCRLASGGPKVENGREEDFATKLYKAKLERRRLTAIRRRPKFLYDSYPISDAEENGPAEHPESTGDIKQSTCHPIESQAPTSADYDSTASSSPRCQKPPKMKDSPSWHAFRIFKRRESPSDAKLQAVSSEREDKSIDDLLDRLAAESRNDEAILKKIQEISSANEEQSDIG